MKVVSFTPIKLNNQRLPGKNTMILGKPGKPLCQYLFSTLQKIDLIDEKYIYCSDDKICKYILSLPNRFEEQIKYLEKFPRIDILGTAINEFTSDPKEIYARRTLPANNYQIYRFASFRCPFNHMTVMFRKSFILSIGSYESFDKYEDYWLWIRAILAGAVCANLNQPLVNVRAGNDMICRRKGWKIFYGEITLLERMKTIKFITKYEFIKLFFLRACPRLLPSHLLKIIYRWLHK